ncbi:helix-turn-helix domain-containing protein [Lachnospiraceae bacterium LCP25S3_G4]
MTVGDRIREKREAIGITQEELAKRLGYKSRSSVNKMETSRELPLKKVEMMAEALCCSPSYLMGWDEEEELADELLNVMYNDTINKINKNIMNMSDKHLKRILKYTELMMEEIEEEKEND